MNVQRRVKDFVVANFYVSDPEELNDGVALVERGIDRLHRHARGDLVPRDRVRDPHPGRGDAAGILRCIGQIAAFVAGRRPAPAARRRCPRRSRTVEGPVEPQQLEHGERLALQAGQPARSRRTPCSASTGGRPTQSRSRPRAAGKRTGSLMDGRRSETSASRSGRTSAAVTASARRRYASTVSSPSSAREQRARASSESTRCVSPGRSVAASSFSRFVIERTFGLPGRIEFCVHAEAERAEHAPRVVRGRARGRGRAALRGDRLALQRLAIAGGVARPDDRTLRRPDRAQAEPREDHDRSASSTAGIHDGLAMDDQPAAATGIAATSAATVASFSPAQRASSVNRSIDTSPANPRITDHRAIAQGPVPREHPTLRDHPGNE